VEIDSRNSLEVRTWKIESLDREAWTCDLKEFMARLRAVAPHKKKKKYEVTNRKDTDIQETQDKTKKEFS
jgi:hypothetical protein